MRLFVSSYWSAGDAGVRTGVSNIVISGSNSGFIVGSLYQSASGSLFNFCQCCGSFGVCLFSFNFFFLLIFIVMSGRPRTSLATRNKLQPSVLHDTTGSYVIVMCGRDFICPNLKTLAQMYLCQWYLDSPPDVESLAGKKKTKK